MDSIIKIKEEENAAFFKFEDNITDYFCKTDRIELVKILTRRGYTFHSAVYVQKLYGGTSSGDSHFEYFLTRDYKPK